jgi:hypothetical protein
MGELLPLMGHEKASQKLLRRYRYPLHVDDECQKVKVFSDLERLCVIQV